MPDTTNPYQFFIDRWSSKVFPKGAESAACSPATYTPVLARDRRPNPEECQDGEVYVWNPSTSDDSSPKGSWKAKRTHELKDYHLWIPAPAAPSEEECKLYEKLKREDRIVPVFACLDTPEIEDTLNGRVLVWCSEEKGAETPSWRPTYRESLLDTDLWCHMPWKRTDPWPQTPSKEILETHQRLREELLRYLNDGMPNFACLTQPATKLEVLVWRYQREGEEVWCLSSTDSLQDADLWCYVLSKGAPWPPAPSEELRAHQRVLAREVAKRIR